MNMNLRLDLSKSETTKIKNLTYIFFSRSLEQTIQFYQTPTYKQGARNMRLSVIMTTGFQ